MNRPLVSSCAELAGQLLNRLATLMGTTQSATNYCVVAKTVATGWTILSSFFRGICGPFVDKSGTNRTFAGAGGMYTVSVDECSDRNCDDGNHNAPLFSRRVTLGECESACRTSALDPLGSRNINSDLTTLDNRKQALWVMKRLRRAKAHVEGRASRRSIPARVISR
jgi:hypothetical protein